MQRSSRSPSSGGRVTVAFRRTFASLRKHRNYRPVLHRTGRVPRRNLDAEHRPRSVRRRAHPLGRRRRLPRLLPVRALHRLRPRLRCRRRPLRQPAARHGHADSLDGRRPGADGAGVPGRRSSACTHWPQPPVPRSSSMLRGDMRSRFRWSAARSFPMRSRSTRASSTARVIVGPRSRASSSPRSASASASRSTLCSFLAVLTSLWLMRATSS